MQQFDGENARRLADSFIAFVGARHDGDDSVVEMGERLDAFLRMEGAPAGLMGSGGTCDGVEFEPVARGRDAVELAGRIWVLGGQHDCATLPVRIRQCTGMTNALPRVVVDIGFGAAVEAKALKLWNSRRQLVWSGPYEFTVEILPVQNW